MFDVNNIAKYKEELMRSEDINAVAKVPLPIIRDDQDHIFISYSHKDYKQVYSDLADLYAAGVRFWYDEGLSAGEEWDLEVNEKLKDPHCSGVIFYMSKNLFISPAAKREISIATGRNEITGEKETAGMAFITVNLTDATPVEILFDHITPEERQAIGFDTRWITLLSNTFSSQRIYLAYNSPRHSTELKEEIGKKFNVMNDTELVVMAEGDYAGETRNGKRHGKGTFVFTSGHTYEGEWRDDRRNGTGTLHRNGAVIYEGEWKDDHRHGRGRCTEPNGDIYDGEWAEDKREGHGVCTYADGAVYEGEWKNGGRDGVGTYTYADKGEHKRVYVGQWKEDRMEGKGLFTFRDQSTYEGEFVNGKMNGHGVRKYASGAVYDGGWKNDKCHGQGTYTYSDGKRWMGEFKEDKMWTGSGFLYYYTNGELNGKTYDGGLKEGKFNGYGIHTYANGAVYEGEWKDGMRDGVGKYVYADEGEQKRTYVGQWKEDRMEGRGLFTYRDQSTYEGEFVDQKFEGHGVRKYADGAVYDGEWKNDKRDGTGTYTYADGHTYAGQWKEGRIEGKGLFTYRDQSTYEGEFVNGKKNGHGVRKYADGSVYDGEWKDDDWNGQGTHTCSDGKQWKGEFKDGKRWNGSGFLYYYTNGKLNGNSYDGDLKEGKHDGHGTYRNADGDVYEGKWKAGKRDGLGNQTYADKRTYVGQWKENRIEGSGIFTYPNQGTYTGDFINGKKNGHGTFKYASGAVYDGEWKNDMWHGQGTYTYSDGKQWKGEFKDGKKWTGSGPLFYQTNGKLNGAAYDGDLKAGKHDGYGVYTYPNGAVYAGEWKDGRENGQGALEWETFLGSEGPVFKTRQEGTWKNGTIIEGREIVQKKAKDGPFETVTDREGKFNYDGLMIGVLKCRKGKRIKTKVRFPEFPLMLPNFVFFRWVMETVIWQFDSETSKTPNGYGKATLYNGTVVEGTFDNGRTLEANVYTVTYTDGLVYVGGLKNYQRDGQGVLSEPDGSRLEGTWSDNRFIKGHAVLINSDGTVHEGDMKDGKLNGPGTLTEADGTVTVGVWKNNKFTRQTTERA